MTTTGPLPAVGRGIATGQRKAILEHMGALCGEAIEYGYATADAVIDPCRGVLYIVADQDPDPSDWAAVCGLIAAVGWDNGSGGPYPRDPGEPALDALSRVCTWRLEYASRCVWCDGRGESYGCPLCEKVRLRYPLRQAPASLFPLSGEAGAFPCPRPVARMMRTW